MLRQIDESLIVGFRRRWKTGALQSFSVIGAIWTFTEIVTKVAKPADEWVIAHGTIYTAVIICMAFLGFLRAVYEVRSVSFTVPTTDSVITIKFGDLFLQDCDWVIGVNEFFDSDLGHVVAQESLHGKFIMRVFNGDTNRFRLELDTRLSGFSGLSTTRNVEPSLKYPIGTTVVLPNGRHKAFLVAMSTTDLATSKAHSTVPLLWNALRGALQSVSDFGNGATLALPLIGNGRSSVNIEPQHLLRLITLALVDFGRRVGLPKNVLIIVPDACFDSLDLREIRRDWKN